MSEPTPERAGNELGAHDVAAVPQLPADSTGTAAMSSLESAGVDAPSIAPDHEAPKPDAPAMDAPKLETPRPETSEPEAPKVDARQIGATKGEASGAPGKLLVMSPGDRAWDFEASASRERVEPKSEAPAKRGGAAMAAVIALAAIVGAASGALATAGVMRFAAGEAPTSHNSGVEASIARIDADLVALKANLEHTSKMGVSQSNKTNDRLEKLEKAQAEPLARLAKLSDTVEKLRTAQAAAPAQASAVKETTGSLAPMQVATAAAVPLPTPAPAAKPEVGRLPTVHGWVLRDVGRGSALIEGRSGLYEVYAGDPVPGLGRVDAIRRQDGRWVVVTTKGLIVAR